MKIIHYTALSFSIAILSGPAGAEIVEREKYRYDPAGNIIEKEVAGEVTRFVYKGNVLKSDSQGTEYLHDDAGRLRGESRNGRTKRELSYQYMDKITRVKENGASTQLFYNAEGNLVGKSAELGTEVFAWDGLGLAIRGEQLFVNEEHLVGGVPAIMNGQVAVSDPLGSTLGRGGDSFDSTAYGQGLEGALFTGKPFVKELRAFVFKHRSFSPRMIRWGSVDPAGYPDGKNNYAYVGGDPLTRYDAMGLAQATLTAHWEATVDQTSYSGDAETLFNYEFQDDENGVSRLDSHSLAGGNNGATYQGALTYTTFTQSQMLDLDNDGHAETQGYDRDKYDYDAGHKDLSGTDAESRTVQKSVNGQMTAVTEWRDRAAAELWINETVTSNLGYYNNGNFVAVNSGNNPSSTSHIDEDLFEAFGDWYER